MQTERTSPPRRKVRTNHLRRFIAPAIGGVLVLAIVAGLRPKPLEVEVGTVVSAPLSISVIEEGKTRIRHRYVVSPPVGGYLRRIPLRPGAKIEAGATVLAEIEAAPASFLDDRTRAEVDARVRAADATRLQRESMVERARTALDLAEKEGRRQEDLKLKGLISQSEWDKAENEVRIRERELHSAEFTLRVAAAEYEQAQAALTQVSQDSKSVREPLRLISPVDGFVLQVFEENARAVTAGMPLLEVGDTTDLEAEIEMLSTDAVGVLPGAEASIERWGGERPLRGRVSLVEPGGYTKISALGVEEQRVRVRVDFAEPLPPGASLGDRFRVEARIVTGHADAALQIPAGAIFRRDGAWMTFVADGGHAHLKRVEIGRHNGLFAEVRGGVISGEHVVLHAPDALTDGGAVAERAK